MHRVISRPFIGWHSFFPFSSIVHSVQPSFQPIQYGDFHSEAGTSRLGSASSGVSTTMGGPLGAERGFATEL